MPSRRQIQDYWKENWQSRWWSQSGLLAYLKLFDAPENMEMLTECLLSEKNSGSDARPEALLRLHSEIFPRKNKKAGQAFWRWVACEWEGFDAIPHELYEDCFLFWAKYWSPNCMNPEDLDAFKSLPNEFTLYRGADEFAPLGLSWTLDRRVAESFSRGHRGSLNQNPVVLEANVTRNAVAFLQTSRQEAEVVLFSLPCDKINYSRARLASAT